MNDKSKFEITREHLKIATVATAAAALAFVIGRCVGEGQHCKRSGTHHHSAHRKRSCLCLRDQATLQQKNCWTVAN